MNTENIKKLQKVLRENKEDFNVSIFSYACGTPACFAGWASAMSEAEGAGLDAEDRSIVRNIFPGIIDDAGFNKDYDFFETAKKYLGLNTHTASMLFYPWFTNPPPGSSFDNEPLTVEEACETLERLTETGEVKWPERVMPSA